jgi:muramoyltetrapeptide carboxypeptidase LdcA involved in peptidoglycan recycling
MEPADGWIWHNGDRVVEGVSWGGNLEIVSWLLMVDRAVQPVDVYSGGVLFLETSEDMPRAQGGATDCLERRDKPAWGRR